MSERRAALHSVLLYSLAIALVSGANFIGVPLLLALLGHDEFARWALLEPILLTALPLAGFGIQIGLLRRVRGGAADDRAAISGLLPFHLGATLVVGLIAVGTARGFGVSLATAALLGTIVTVEGSIIFFVGLWRAQDRPTLFATVEGGRAVTIAALLVLALIFLGSSALVTDDYLILRLCIGLTAVALAVAVVRPQFRPSLAEAQRAVRYGAPIVVASMLAAMLISVDRYALAHVDPEGLAHYVAHVKLAQLLSVAVAAFYTWFAPKAIQCLGDGPSAHPFFVGSTSVLVVALVGICANVWLLVPSVWPWFFPTISLDRQLFGILLIGIAVFSLGNPLSLGALRPGKTHHAIVITLAALAIGVGASFSLAGPLGEVGVAYGRGLGLAAYTAFFAANTIVSLRIRYPWAKYAALVLGAVIVCMGAELLLPGQGLTVAIARLASINVVFLGLVVWRVSVMRQGLAQES